VYNARIVPRVLVVDNHDSFTYNLVQELRGLGAECVVCLSDRTSIEEITGCAPRGIILSPGPGTPHEAGITLSVIRELAGRIPLFGVCLGHQAIGQIFGAKLGRAPILMHGKTSPIEHDGRSIFAAIPSPFAATRYHSLVLDANDWPSVLEVSARSADGLVMGLRHRQLPIEGVQFHPEAYLTEHGARLLDNWLKSL
jgi:anthranilate synthase/aminodeoxychorismate synthase-like glutamine amidotransferase